MVIHHKKQKLYCNCTQHEKLRRFLLMEFIIKNILPTDNVPEILLNGSKLLVIKFMGIKIIDSINFIPMALSKMPKTFGLNELKKGFFPHFFNTPKNQSFIGSYPDQSRSFLWL